MTDPSQSGILTFLFTDLEDSTRLWEQFPVEMRRALARHDAILTAAVKDHGGGIVKSTGDGLHAVFENPSGALAAALAGQQALIEESWPEKIGLLKVRMGLHTGESQEREHDFYGPQVNLAARVMGAGHGGQVLLSDVTARLLQSGLPTDCSLIDLGSHRLKGISAPQQLFQLAHPDLESEFPGLKTLSAFRHNLPRQISSFVGREKEIADVHRLLQETRLLTLLGPGGTGKTRLMLQSAEEAIEEFADGVWLVELAPLTDPAMILERVSTALKVQSQQHREEIEVLKDFLRTKEALVLLDNVEHVVRESAELAETLLASCAKLKILVTGREALFISGEVTLQIPSMTLPERGKNGSDLAALKKCESVRLFIERARAVQPGFDLIKQNAGALVEIVNRLDGIPLALELAAARLRMLSVEKIAERLNDRFRLLTGGRRTALPRQQTLQALIDWSWNLLEEHERILLRRLSVFANGWSLEAAEAVCGFEPMDEIEVFDNLDQLVNKSLVTVNHLPEGETRYGLLESIRQFSQDRLFEAGEGKTLRDRHTEYFLFLAEEARDRINSADMLSWVNRLRRDLDNLRAVMEWTLEEQPGLALQLASILGHQFGFWITPMEGQEWLTKAISKTRKKFEAGSPDIQPNHFIRALIGLGIMQGMMGDAHGSEESSQEAMSLAKKYGDDRSWIMGLVLSFYPKGFDVDPKMIPLAKEAIRISRENNYTRELSYILMILGGLYLFLGEVEKGQPYIAEGLRLTKEIDNPRDLARVFDIQGMLFQFEGRDLEKAKWFLLQAIQKFEAIGDQQRLNMDRSGVAHILRAQGKFEEAKSWYRKTILAWQEQGHHSAMAHQLECFGFIALTQEDPVTAAHLIGAARAVRDRVQNYSTSPIELKEMEQAMLQLSEMIGEEARDSALGEGALISLDDAVQLALEI